MRGAVCRLSAFGRGPAKICRFCISDRIRQLTLRFRSFNRTFGDHETCHWFTLRNWHNLAVTPSVKTGDLVWAASRT